MRDSARNIQRLGTRFGAAARAHRTSVVSVNRPLLLLADFVETSQTRSSNYPTLVQLEAQDMAQERSA